MSETATYTVVGNVVGPIGDPPPTHTGEHMETNGSPTGASLATGTSEVPGGPIVSQGGYTLDLQADTAEPGRDRIIEFDVTGPDGEPVTEYVVEHEKELHLIVVRHDFTGFQHVHPRRDARGSWSVPVDLRSGQWRVFADFTPVGGDGLTLGADLLVTGNVDAAPESPETRTAQVDGYTVTMVGALVAGADAGLTLTVSKGGKPVTDLQPYLGAYGHLVALREDDLAYLHVHPDGAPNDGLTEAGPEVVFYAAVPSDGGYRLYLDFKHDGVVRTAAFVLGTSDSDKAAEPTPRSDTDNDSDENEDSAHGH